MLVFRFGKFIVPTNFVNGSRLVGSEIRTKASPQPLAVTFMNLSKLRTLSIVFFLIINLLVGRVQSQSVFKVEDNLMIGDKSSLFELIKYFDSSRQIVELSCAGKVPLYGIAKRIFSENCAFTEEEIGNLEYYEDYLEFLNKNYDRITFFEEAKVFLITPLNERGIKYEIKRFNRFDPNQNLFFYFYEMKKSMKNLIWLDHN